MKNRTMLAGFVMLLMVLTTFAAIPASATAATAAADDDVLYVAMQQDMPDFNWWNLNSNSVWKSNVIQYAFEAIAGLDYNLQPYPLLAESWTFDDANLTVDITLRQGVLFHDGVELTADDIVFSYTMARDSTTYASPIIAAFDADSNNTVDLDEIRAGVQKTGEYSVRMVMAKPYGQFFTSTLGVAIAPEHIWNQTDHLNADYPGDYLMDVNYNEVDAVIGTGAFYYLEGVTNSYRVMAKNEDYWGKDFTTPTGHPNFPQTIDKIHFKIYANIDTAILALQAGDVDYIAWAITAGRVPALQADPNIGLRYLSDNGYFYVAFNMKKPLMGDLSFRQAVSHLIDKNQIVNVYMSGFGQAGSAVVPPFYPDWFNPTVTTYPFDLTTAAGILDDAGYADINDDGWREMPDESLMEKITLMTPPADYDPIRIRAGQMIATNMREVGINCEAKAIDFDTLVAKMTAFDYQMLELGWKFSGPEAVGLVFDIYAPNASSNSWGFWSEEYPNPWYSGLGGVSTSADAATQEMANEVGSLEALARGSFVVADQINYTKQAQAVLADAIPCNILYYRVNVEAYRNSWTNWTPFMGTLWNGFTVCELGYSGEGGISGGTVTTGISAGVSTPGKLMFGETGTASVAVVDNTGAAVSGASVEVDLVGVVGDATVTADPATGTTDAAGMFSFDLTGVGIGQTVVNVTVTSGTFTANDASTVLVVSGGMMGLKVMPEKLALVAGETIDVTMTVMSPVGDPVEGATITVDPYLLGYGTVDPATATTDADGVAVITYTAPADPGMNMHYLATISATASMEGFTSSNTAAVGLLVYNDAAPDWKLVMIDSVGTTALSTPANTTTISVMAVDAAGTPLVGQTLDVWYSDETMVYAPVTTVDTDPSGMADVTVQIKDLPDSGAVWVTIGSLTEANVISEVVTLTYDATGSPPATEIYGGYVTYALPKFVEALGSVDVTFHVWDSQGNAPEGLSASVVVAATSYGQLVDFTDAEYNSLWDYAGINIVTDADGANIVTAGSFAMNYPDWDLYGVTLTAGEYSTTLTGVSIAHLDVVCDLFIVPDGVGTYNMDTWNYDIYGATTISSHYGYGRSYAAAMVSYDISKPALTAKAAEFDTAVLTVTVTDQDNVAIEGATVDLYQFGNRYNIQDYAVLQYEFVGTRAYFVSASTDADGVASATVVAAALSAATMTFDSVCRVTPADLFVKATVDGAITIIDQTQLVIEAQRAFLTVEPIEGVQAIGSTVAIKVTAVDAYGAPIAALPVQLTSNIGTLAASTMATGEDGVAVFSLDTSGISGTMAAMISVNAVTGGDLYEAATARTMIAAANAAPAISVLTPEADAEVVGNVSVLGSIFDANGIAEATIAVDGGTPVALTGTEGATVWDIADVLGALDDGEHTVVVYANDTLGVSSELEVAFTTSTADTGGGADVLAWGLAAVGWIIAAVVIVLLLMKKPKAQKTAEPEVGPETEEKKD